jgi:hypothetical protein
MIRRVSGNGGKSRAGTPPAGSAVAKGMLKGAPDRHNIAWSSFGHLFENP